MNDQSEDKQYTIILAEDDQFIARACANGLKEAGFRVVSVNSGNEVVGTVMREKPNIVLLDLILPLKTGFEILKELRKIDEFSNLPIIVFSSLSQDKDIEEAMRLGATDYIVKSDTPLRSVINKVNQYLVEKDTI